MDAFDVLVIVLSVVLAIFLMLAIVLIVYLIKISRRMHEISEKARSAASSMEMTANLMKKGVIPTIISKIAVNFIRGIISKDSKVKRKD